MSLKKRVIVVLSLTTWFGSPVAGAAQDGNPVMAKSKLDAANWAQEEGNVKGATEMLLVAIGEKRVSERSRAKAHIEMGNIWLG